MLYIHSPLFCLRSVRYIFALNMFELGCINSTEWTVYQDWHSLLVEQFGHRVELEGIIYLRAPPKVRARDFMSHPRDAVILAEIHQKENAFAAMLYLVNVNIIYGIVS